MTCLQTGGYYDAGQVCFDMDDGLGEGTHECRCPLGTEKEYYTHEHIALYDAEDGAIDGVIEFTKVMRFKWLIISYESWILSQSFIFNLTTRLFQQNYSNHIIHKNVVVTKEFD